MQTTQPESSTTLRSQREQRGWSQAQLAEAIGVSVPTISRLEAGLIQPNRAQIFLLATLFNVRQGVIEDWLGIGGDKAA